MMPYKIVPTERGTLYQYLPILSAGYDDEKVRCFCFKWSNSEGTFDELAYRLAEWRYGLYIDDRSPMELRLAKPGYAVIGKRYPSIPEDNAVLVGFFIPEGTEDQVALQIAHELGPVIFIPKTLPEICWAIPVARFLVSG